MSRWFRFYDAVLDDPKVQALPGNVFRARLLEALDGTENEFTPFVRGPYHRPLAHEWRDLRRQIFERDDYTCQYCGERGGKLECDRVVPVARGGSSDPENLATACFACNRSKRSRPLSEWRA